MRGHLYSLVPPCQGGAGDRPRAGDRGTTVIDLAHDAPPARDGQAISQVSQLLGVPATTLRSWERRYGIPVVSRSPGGHRRYAEDELVQLRLMRDEISRGKRAGMAATEVRLLLDRDNPQSSRIAQVLAAVEAKDSSELTHVLDRAHDRIGLAATIDSVLMPALRQVGAWWESGRCDLPQEQLLTKTARTWLARLRVLGPVLSDEPPILLACGPDDRHTIGLEALAALLAENHRAFHVLASTTSAPGLVAAARTTAVAAVVVVSQLPSHRRAAIAAVRAVDAAGYPVFYAGNAFNLGGERRTVPGTHLGPTFAQAVSTLLAAVTPEMTTPEPADAGPGVVDLVRDHTVGLTGFEPATP